MTGKILLPLSVSLTVCFDRKVCRENFKFEYEKFPILINLY